MAFGLTVCQQHALEAIKQSHNTVIIGQAGTGKTFLVREAVRQLRKAGKTVAVTASTGIAATQFEDGETLHSWSGILDGRFSDHEAVERVSTQVRCSFGFCNIYK